jgi:hypothetical protein
VDAESEVLMALATKEYGLVGNMCPRLHERRKNKPSKKPAEAGGKAPLCLKSFVSYYPYWGRGADEENGVVLDQADRNQVNE